MEDLRIRDKITARQVALFAAIESGFSGSKAVIKAKEYESYIIGSAIIPEVETNQLTPLVDSYKELFKSVKSDVAGNRDVFKLSTDTKKSNKKNATNKGII